MRKKALPSIAKKPGFIPTVVAASKITREFTGIVLEVVMLPDDSVLRTEKELVPRFNKPLQFRLHSTAR